MLPLIYLQLLFGMVAIITSIAALVSSCRRHGGHGTAMPLSNLK